MSRTLERIERELGSWPGVTYVVEPGRNHPKLRLSYGDRSVFLPFSTTNVDPRGILNKIGQIRRALRDLGAVRDASS